MLRSHGCYVTAHWAVKIASDFALLHFSEWQPSGASHNEPWPDLISTAPEILDYIPLSNNLNHK